jgi:hypothetical protein
MGRFVLTLHPAPEYASIHEERRLHKARAAALKKLRPLVTRLVESSTDAAGIETRVYDPKPPKAPAKPKRWRAPKPVAVAVYMARHRAAMEAAVMRTIARDDDPTDVEWGAWRASVFTWDHRPDPVALQQDRIEGLVVANWLGRWHALDGVAELTISKRKGGTLSTPTIENAAKELRLLYETAARLVAGGGGPEQFRSSDGGDLHSMLPRYGRGDLNVLCESVRHKPAPAMAIAGFILYGRDWDTPFRELGLNGDLTVAFHALADRFGGPIGLTFDDGPALVDAVALRQVLEAPGRTSLISIPKPAIAAPSSAAIDAVQRRALEHTARLALPGKGG